MPAPKKTIPGMELPQPFIVKMDEQKKPDAHLPYWAIAVTSLIILVLIASIILWTQFILSKATTGTSDALQVSVLMDVPRYASLRDVLPVTVTLHNNSGQTLDFDLTLVAEPQGDIMLGKDGTDVFHVKDLPPGGTVTHTFTYLPVHKPAGGSFAFKVVLDKRPADPQAVNAAQPPDQFHEEIVSAEWTSKVISKATHLRSSVNYLLTGGLFSTVIALFGEKVKKALGFS
jgi:hypothetical protein